ncbi:hypothetical protein ACV3R5_14875 [Clostridium perfringens]|uniref:hypothetical protein n=1 Tax=Clostridium perfringens TaxID=1502 RepID=UPI0039EA23EE
MTDYMKETYGLNVLTWFDKGITYKYQKYIQSFGYINEDNTIDECERNSGSKKKIQLEIRLEV